MRKLHLVLLVAATVANAALAQTPASVAAKAPAAAAPAAGTVKAVQPGLFEVAGPRQRSRGGCVQKITGRQARAGAPSPCNRRGVTAISVGRRT